MAKANAAQRTLTVKSIARNLSPLWFTWCMNSGIIAIVMHQLPYQFSGLQVIATVAYMIDLVLFATLSILFLLRFAIFGKHAYHQITGSTSELPLLACWPIAWLTIMSFMALTVSQSYWGGYAFTIVAYVFWWIGVVWTIGIALFIVIVTCHRQNARDQPLLPLVLMPAVGLATLATVGGLMSSFANGISATLAVPVIITSFCVVGISLFMALILYTILLHKMMTHGMPDTSQAASLFVLVGPMGQISAALQLNSSAASTYGKFAGYSKGTFLTAMASSPLNVTCVLLGLMLTGMGTFWLLIAFFVMLEHGFKRDLTWTPAWNGIIFPTGTLATSMILLSIELDSPFFRVISAILLLFMVLIFLVNFIFTVRGIARGELLADEASEDEKQS